MIFTIDNQLEFAKLSGDYNPLHIEPLFARRLPYGGVVVHGAAAVLKALDEWSSTQSGFLEFISLKVNFRKPVLINQHIRWRTTQSDERSISIVLESDGANHIEIKASFVTKTEKRISDKLPDSHSDNMECRIVTKEDIEHCSGTVDLFLDYALYEKLFPNLSRKCSDIQIAQIIATNRIVGMRCPGYHSLYSGCELSFTENTGAAPLSYRVAGYDKNFSRCKITIEGTRLSGVLIAFYRPESYKQPDFSAFRGAVSHDEFKGQRALIIGGSRGLGEVTAKILAAGGADIALTYHRGKEDAERIIGNIAAGHAVHFDVLRAASNPPFDTPTHLYYFATPAIFLGTKNVFSTELFRKFCDYYVTGFINTVKTLLRTDRPLNVFYPSSVAIDETPSNMGEYVVAKAAGESAGGFLEKTNKNLKIHIVRLPRLATDQTVDIRSNLNQDPVPFMLEELRRFNKL